MGNVVTNEALTKKSTKNEGLRLETTVYTYVECAGGCGFDSDPHTLEESYIFSNLSSIIWQTFYLAFTSCFDLHFCAKCV